MKRYKIYGIALVVVSGLSVLIVSAPAAAIEFLLAEWLAAGARITIFAQASDVEEELNLITNNGGGLGVKSQVLCSGIFDGTTGSEYEGKLGELLSLSGIAISMTALVGTALSCTNEANCTEPLVTADNLWWKTELELMVDGTETFFVNLLLNAGYYVECLILGITINELCETAETAVNTTNEAGGVVDQEFSDTFQVLAGLKLWTCTLGGMESAEVTGLGTLLLTSGTALTASSE